MAIQYYMDYAIIFQDPGEYALAVAQAGGNLIKLAPRDAATLFGIPFPYPSGNLATIPRAITFFFPFTPGAEFRFPGATGIFVDDTILTKVIPGQAGNPASAWPAGPDGIMTWSGNIITNKGAATSAEPVPVAISDRRWIMGAELTRNEGGAVQNIGFSRDYSRTVDGIGWGIRGTNITGANNHSVTQFRPAYTPRNSWDRFYFRVRRLPTVNPITFFRTHGVGANAAGHQLKVLTNGDIQSSNISAGGGVTVKGIVFNAVLNTWYRVDTLYRYGLGLGPPPTGVVRFFINGVAGLSWTDGAAGMAEASALSSAELGAVADLADAEVEVDFDDWVNADIPLNFDNTLTPIDGNFPIDWLVGSHIKLHYNQLVSQVNWAPATNGLVINQPNTPEIRQAGTAEMTSSTAVANIEGLTDMVLLSIADSIASIIGAVTSILSIWSKNAVGTDGQLGYRKAGAAAVMTTIDQTIGEAGNLIMFQPGQILPGEWSPWSLSHTKSNDANLDTTYMMMSIIEYIGVWAAEDNYAFQYPITRLSYLHNCRYANTVWGYLGSQPDAPQYTIGFTYVGNGAYQEFVLPAPAHFVRIRPVTDNTAGIWFFAASLGAHLGQTDEVVQNIRMWFDLTNQVYKLSVAGNSGNGVNITAKTYQVIVFCDPGMRFCLASAFSHGATSSTPKNNPLVNPNFTPDITFFQNDNLGSAAVGNGSLLKGPNDSVTHGARNLQATSEVTNVADLVLGNIQSYSGLHQASTGPINFIAFRKQDSGPLGCLGNIVVQIQTYVGNASGANRVIAITPASSRFPLLTIVWPNSGGGDAYTRDPSHAGANSSSMRDNTPSATAIVAVGIDQITINNSLNAGGVPYTIFTFCGDSAGNNNGTFFSTYCGAGDPPWLPPIPPNTDPNIIGNGGLILGGAAPFTIIKNASGIYTLVPGQNRDALIDRNTAPSGQLNLKIPDPTWKTGYLGG